MRRRAVMAVVGSGGQVSEAVLALAEDLGRRAVEAEFRLVTGGLGGVMEATSRGAKRAANAADGDVIGILPGYNADAANRHVDIVLPTGLGHGRNLLVVAAADVVVAVCGATGTLSEVAFAWRLRRPVIVLSTSGGVAANLASLGSPLHPTAEVHPAQTPAKAVELARAFGFSQQLT